MRLIIVRHAETVRNVREIISGHKPGQLTEKGREQAIKLALRLKDEKIDAIYSSDLQRAVDTVKEIAVYHDVPLHYTPELRERYLGSYEGRPRAEYFKAQEESGLSFAEFNPEGAESFGEMKERAQRFLDELYAKHDVSENQTILISSHGGFIKMLLANLLKKSMEEMLQTNQSNACINIVEVGTNLVGTAQVLNSIEHL